MKANIGKKVIKKRKAVDIGEPGDFILIRAVGKEGYSFGRLEGVVEHQRPLKSPKFKELTGKKIDITYIEFRGDSYRLTSNNVMGAEIPYLSLRVPSRHSFMDSTRYMEARRIETIIAGADNIATHLETAENGKYSGHADLIRKIAEAQRSRGRR